MPSPFTEALVDSLQGSAQDSDGDGYIDLTDLSRAIDAKLKRKGLLPQKDFDASGEVQIARTPTASIDTDVNLDEEVRPRGSSKDEVIEQGAPRREPSRLASEIPNIRFRSRGDYSKGDLRTWFVCLLLAVSASIASIISFNTWEFAYSNENGEFLPDPRRYISLAALAVASLIFMICVIEGFNLRFKVPGSRRSALMMLDSPVVRRLHRGRDTLAYLGGSLTLSPLFGVESTRPLWSIALAALGGICLITLLSQSHFGDASYLAGCFLLAIGMCLPVTYNDRHWQTGLESVSGFLLLLVVVMMVIAWWLRAPTLVLASLSIASGVVVLNLFYSDFGEPVVGSYVALVGAVLTFAAAALGCGAILENVGSSDRSRTLAS